MIMTQKDCEEWAAMIAQMEDDPSYHPTYNKKGVRVSKDRGPNDLEQVIETLKFRNDKLHQHNEKLTNEILDVREKNKKLESLLMQQYRDKGVL
jgi:flagellar capping protein FliD